MNGYVAGFDQFSSIDYRSITKLFYDKFPYKVLIEHGITRPDITLPYQVRWEATNKYRDTKKRFFYRRRQHCPADMGSWRHMDNGLNAGTISFFFENEADALFFIRKNKRYVKTVYRPENRAEIKAIEEQRTSQIVPVVRDVLFWAKYRWRIEFKRHLSKEELTHLDEWVRETFMLRSNGHRRSLSQQRASYSFSASRCLYLHTETDVIFTKLGVGEYINKVNKALLKEEIYEH